MIDIGSSSILLELYSGSSFFAQVVLKGHGGACALNRRHYLIDRKFLHHKAQWVTVGREDGSCALLASALILACMLSHCRVVDPLRRFRVFVERSRLLRLEHSERVRMHLLLLVPFAEARINAHPTSLIR